MLLRGHFCQAMTQHSVFLVEREDMLSHFSQRVNHATGHAELQAPAARANAHVMQFIPMSCSG